MGWYLTCGEIFKIHMRAGPSCRSTKGGGIYIYYIFLFIYIFITLYIFFFYLFGLTFLLLQGIHKFCPKHLIKLRFNRMLLAAGNGSYTTNRNRKCQNPYWSLTSENRGRNFHYFNVFSLYVAKLGPSVLDSKMVL